MVFYFKNFLLLFYTLYRSINEDVMNLSDNSLPYFLYFCGEGGGANNLNNKQTVTTFATTKSFGLFS